MTTTYVYKIRDKRTDQYFDEWGWFEYHSGGTEFKTEKQALAAMQKWMHRKVYGSTTSKQDTLTAEDIKQVFPQQLEIVKVKITRTDESITDLAEQVKDAFLYRKIDEANPAFGDFWINAQKKGYADKIQFIVKLASESGTYRMKTVKEARAQLRLLGIKTRTFREHEGMFGFYNKDQAFKARLTLDISAFIDISELRTKLFV